MCSESAETVFSLRLFLIPKSDTCLRPSSGLGRILIRGSHCGGNGVGSWKLPVGLPEALGWTTRNPQKSRIPSSQGGGHFN